MEMEKAPVLLSDKRYCKYLHVSCNMQMQCPVLLLFESIQSQVWHGSYTDHRLDLQFSFGTLSYFETTPIAQLPSCHNEKEIIGKITLVNK